MTCAESASCRWLLGGVAFIPVTREEVCFERGVAEGESWAVPLVVEFTVVAVTIPRGTEEAERKESDMILKGHLSFPRPILSLPLSSIIFPLAMKRVTHLSGHVR